MRFKKEVKFVDKNLIIGTAGHVDHGKTTLIKALTGHDTDRLDEEKERGVSIDLGFSSLKLTDDLQVGIIDVPGHEKFIKNMLAGAGGVDVGLLVIAADEAVMPQTKEHLAILDLLGVERGLIAVTKADLVDDEWLELVVEEVKEQVSDTFLAEAPVVTVSGKTGEGLDRLKQKIAKVAEEVPNKDKTGNVYFPIDRVFTLSGHGTVVTGTLIKGTIETGDQLEIFPSKLEARVRSLQVHGSEVETAYPGQRVGINLANLDTEDIDRGDVLATKNSLTNTDYLDARLDMLETAPMILNHGDRIRLHLGAKEVIGRVYMLDNEELLPGESGLVQLRLEDTIVANFKEKYVLRQYSPMTTIGGGEILEPNPDYHHKFETEVISDLKIKESGTSIERIKLALESVAEEPLTIEDLVTETSLARGQLCNKLEDMKNKGEVIEFDTGKKSRWLAKSSYNKLKEEALKELKKYHENYYLRSGLNKEELRTKLSIDLAATEYDILIEDLEEAEKLEVESAKVSLVDFEIELTSREQELKQEIMDRMLDDEFSPPEREEIISDYSEKDLASELFDLLVEREKLIKADGDIYFHSDAVEEAAEMLVDYLEENGDIELAQFRDLLGSSRKYTLALLKYFDRTGVTVRKGDKRLLANS